MDGLEEDDVILYLLTEGVPFLGKRISENSKDQVYQYLNRYLTETDIFTNGIMNFANMLYIGDPSCFKLWEIIQERSSDTIILTVLSQIFILSKNYEFFLKSDVLRRVLDYDRVKKLLCNDYIWNVKNGYNIQCNSILGIAFHGISGNDKEWDKKIDAVHKIFDPLVRNNDLRGYIVKWFANVFNYNVIKLSMSYDTPVASKTSDDTFLVNVLGLLIRFWNIGVIDRRNGVSLKAGMMDRVKFEYIISQDCPIRWYNKDSSVDITNPNFLSQVFFLILNGIRIAYSPIMKIFETWPDLLAKLEHEKEIIEISGPGMLSEITLMSIYNEIDFVKKSIDASEEIIKNQSISLLVDTFYQHFVNWYFKHGHGNLEFDDVFSDMIDYYLLNSRIKTVTDVNLLKLLLELTSSSKHTKNPTIKYNAHLLLYIKKLSDPDSVSSSEIIDAFIKLIISINKFRGDIPVQTFIHKKQVYKNLYKVVKSIDITQFNHVIDKNKVLSRKLGMIIVNDLVWLGDNISPIIDELDEDLSNDKVKAKKSRLLYEILGYFTGINSVIYNLINDSIVFRNIIRSDEIISNFALAMNLSLKWLVDDLKFGFPYSDIAAEFKKPIDFNRFTDEIIAMFNMMMDNKIFVQTLIDDHKVFNLSRFEGVDKLAEFTQTLKSFISRQSEAGNDVVYPDEFLDPIMCTKIETPVMLPDNDDIFVEKSIIEKHLLTEETNPFNRSKLTIQQLEEYNKTPLVIQKIDAFLKRMRLWEKENKIK